MAASFIAGSGGIAAILVAIALSVWQTRKTEHYEQLRDHGGNSDIWHEQPGIRICRIRTLEDEIADDDGSENPADPVERLGDVDARDALLCRT